ncbi:acid-sensing ion channel 5-like isoform X2 [Amphiura filiformis]|uniref:acid-sensing ion channel 5-like isoform X2 n=1 Tax=Amphiura filiformis TaxID=82378 RepID=UPI003B21B560
MLSKRISVGHGPNVAATDTSLPGRSRANQDIQNSGWGQHEPEPVKTKTTLCDIVNEYGETGSAHAFPRIITTNHWWAKLFWLIVSCGLAVLFGYQGYWLLIDFFTWPYSTKIDIISKYKVEFPAVTVCNMNRMRRSELVGTRYQGIIDVDGGFDLDSDYSWFWDFSSDFYNNWLSSTSSAGSSSAGSSAGSSSGDAYGGWSSYDYIPWWDASWFDDFYFDSVAYSFVYDDYLNWDVEGDNDWEGFVAQSKTGDYSDIADIANPTREELEMYGHQAEDFILQCTFDKRGCNYTDFRQFQNNQYGNCYTFNHGFNNDTVRKTSKSGAQFGLHLTLFIEQPEYVGIFSHESGVRVSIHSADVQPSPQDIGITATTGMATSIGVRQSKIERLGGKYTKPKCTPDGAETGYSHPEYSYSSLACKKQCLQNKLKEMCNCVTDVLIEGDKCSYVNTTQQQCRQATERLYNNDEICDCPDACNEIIYPTSVSSALWPSDKYEQHLYHKVSQENVKAARTLTDVESTRKNLVRLRIYFEELNYQLIEQQKAWSIEGISGAVGGLMGLYLGISAVSILEIFIFLLKVLIYILSCGRLNSVYPTPRV